MVLRDIEDIYPLTPMQQGMVFHTLYDPGAAVYFEQLVMTLEGDLDVDALQRAWQQTSTRHAVLKSAVMWEGLRSPVQVVRRGAEVPFERHDLSGLPADERDAALADLLAADRARGFELDRAPLQRVAVVRVDERRHVVVWSHHHLLLDGWSAAIVRAEIFSRYHALTRGEEMPVTPARPYRDFIAWLQSHDSDAAETYWRETLAGFTAPTPLIYDRDTGGDGSDRHLVDLEPEVAAALVALTRSERVTLNTIIQGAWALLLSRYSGERDVVFGATVSGRPTELDGIEGMVGLFINTVPVRVDVSGDAPAGKWLAELQDRQAEQRSFEHTSLTDIQSWSELPGGVALFDTIVVFESYPSAGGGQKAESDVTVSGMRAIERTNYPLSLLASPGPGDNVSIAIDYERSRFRPETIARMATHLANLLGAIATSPNAPVSELEMLDEPERRHLTVELNDTAVDYPDDVCLHELFAAQVAKTPDAVAVTHGDDELTYQELNEAANRLARHLVSLGVGPDTLVGLCLQRSLDMVVGLLGILKAGGAYVPLDPDYPPERLAFMLTDTGASVLVTSSDLLAGLPSHEAALVVVDADKDAIAAHPDTNPDHSATPDDLAYVIYTSGSTGTPKGVAVRHSSVVNLAEGLWRKVFGRSGGLALATLNASLSFDASVQQLTLLARGVALDVVPEWVRRDPAAFVERYREHGYGAIDCTPSQLNAWIEAGLLRTRSVHPTLLLIGGEAIPPALWEALSGGDWLAFNVYGPTETTVDATAGGPELTTPSIGRPLANVQTYILDRHGNPVPIGVAGELYIGGAGVARGYLNRAALTAERFVPDPFSGAPGARLYRTGDRTRYLPDGNIEFLGRVDHQVKIRGFRIEPGEIEAALVGHEALRDAVVIARSDGDGDDKRLVAYVVAVDGEVPTTTELRAHLSETLPDHMVPSAFVVLDELPLTPNGKLDRAALPAPEGRPELQSAYVAPRTPTEEILAEIWSELLGVEQVGVNDNFFELGGHSLIAIKVVLRVQSLLDTELGVRSVFEAPTLEALAAVVEGLILDEIEALPESEVANELSEMSAELGGRGDTR